MGEKITEGGAKALPLKTTKKAPSVCIVLTDEQWEELTELAIAQDRTATATARRIFRTGLVNAIKEYVNSEEYKATLKK